MGKRRSRQRSVVRTSRCMCAPRHLSLCRNLTSLSGSLSRQKRERAAGDRLLFTVRVDRSLARCFAANSGGRGDPDSRPGGPSPDRAQEWVTSRNREQANGNVWIGVGVAQDWLEVAVWLGVKVCRMATGGSAAARLRTHECARGQWRPSGWRQRTTRCLAASGGGESGPGPESARAPDALGKTDRESPLLLGPVRAVERKERPVRAPASGPRGGGRAQDAAGRAPPIDQHAGGRDRLAATGAQGGAQEQRVAHQGPQARPGRSRATAHGEHRKFVRPAGHGDQLTGCGAWARSSVGRSWPN